jgi:hypothetical protein
VLGPIGFDAQRSGSRAGVAGRVEPVVGQELNLHLHLRSSPTEWELLFIEHNNESTNITKPLVLSNQARTRAQRVAFSEIAV